MWSIKRNTVCNCYLLENLLHNYLRRPAFCLFDGTILVVSMNTILVRSRIHVYYIYSLLEDCLISLICTKLFFF